MLKEFEGTKYCPFDWLDEIVPVLADDPADIVFAAGPTGWLMLADENEEDEEAFSCRRSLEPGQVVEFGATRVYGTFEMWIGDDGGYEFPEPYPEDATHFRLADADDLDIHDSIDELVKAGSPEDFSGNTLLEPGTYGVDIWYWSKPIPFRFEVEDGKPKFVRCAGVS